MTDEEFEALTGHIPTDDPWGVYVRQLRVRSQHISGQPGALDGDMTIEALPTWYSGIVFRSKLEADWAATLDSHGIRWEYEPETITLPSGARYIPDFWLPELGTWIEVKGTGVPRIEKAIEFGEARACHCEDTCTCAFAGGELVLIGHPAKPYDPYLDPAYDDAPGWMLRRHDRHHPGHTNWSPTQARTAWFIHCPDCARSGWFTGGRCRGCGGRMAGGHAYRSGDPGMQFVNSNCRPAPARPTADDGEAA